MHNATRNEVPSRERKVSAKKRATKHITYHIRNSVLRASSPALRTTDDRPALPTVSAPLVPTAGAPAALALFAAAAARSRFAPLGRFTRVSVVAPARGGSRSMRRRNGLGRFSSSCKSYVGGAAASLVTVRVVPDDDEDDDDDEGGGGGFAVMEVGAIVSRGSEGSLAALVRVREDTEGRRRRRVG
jgi:hypothetical protein